MCPSHFLEKTLYESGLTLTLNNLPIPIETTFKFLGVHFDKKLSWNAHVSITLAKASRNLNAIKILARDEKPICAIRQHGRRRSDPILCAPLF